MNIIILGPVGSGKSTQSKFLSEMLGLPALSAGDLVYYASQGEGEQAEKIKEWMRKGELIPDEIMLDLIQKHLSGSEHEKGTIIDGFPRTLLEAKMFSLPVDKVIYIDVPDFEVTKRLLSRGRVDDTPSVISRRLEIYHKKTEPVLDFYRTQGLLARVDGTSLPEEVFSHVQTALEK